MSKAFACFKEATEKDPSYAAPHAGLADAHVILGFTGLLAPALAWEAAFAEARRAIQLDASLAEAHVPVAFVRLFRDWDFAGAEEELDQAVALCRGVEAAPHQWRAILLDVLGRFEEAALEIERARGIDPVSPVVHVLAGLQHALARRHEAALEQYRSVVEMEPHSFLGYWGLGLALLETEREHEAVAAHRKALELGEGAPFLSPVLARTLALAGFREEARALLAGASAISAFQRATVEVALGENEAALASLEAACEQRDPWVVWLRVEPMLDPLRPDARFQALVRRVFPAPARASSAGRRGATQRRERSSR